MYFTNAPCVKICPFHFCDVLACRIHKLLLLYITVSTWRTQTSLSNLSRYWDDSGALLTINLMMTCFSSCVHGYHVLPASTARRSSPASLCEYNFWTKPWPFCWLGAGSHSLSQDRDLFGSCACFTSCIQAAYAGHFCAFIFVKVCWLANIRKLRPSKICMHIIHWWVHIDNSTLHKIEQRQLTKFWLWNS